MIVNVCFGATDLDPTHLEYALLARALRDLAARVGEGVDRQGIETWGFRRLARLDAVTLRFNYRDAGRCTPTQFAEFWLRSHVPAEHDFHADLAAAVAFLRSVLGANVPLALVGYSFGCALLHRERRGGKGRGHASGPSSWVVAIVAAGRAPAGGAAK